MSGWRGIRNITKVTRLSHIERIDLVSILPILLPWPFPQHLEAQAPKIIGAPSGSNIRIYDSERSPILDVRLQELFGLADTPRVANGCRCSSSICYRRRDVLCKSPKDLKGRYP